MRLAGFLAAIGAVLAEAARAGEASGLVMYSSRSS